MSSFLVLPGSPPWKPAGISVVIVDIGFVVLSFHYNWVFSKSSSLFFCNDWKWFQCLKGRRETRRGTQIKKETLECYCQAFYPPFPLVSRYKFESATLFSIYNEYSSQIQNNELFTERGCSAKISIHWCAQN